MQLNNFLDFQNTFGSAFAEELLKQICARGRSLLPSELPMAVIQPDRLAITFENNAADRPNCSPRWRRHVRAPYMIDGVPVHVDFVIGAAEFDTHARTAEELLQKASIAMHTAATRMRPFYLYESCNRPHQPRQPDSAWTNSCGACQQRICHLASGEGVAGDRSRYAARRRCCAGGFPIAAWSCPAISSHRRRNRSSSTT